MEDSPLKSKTSSKVIDQLHSQIDDLKQELETTKLSHDNYKKKYEITVHKNESFIDQLANAKHENDINDALLKRKERRIRDLEDQYNEVVSSNENLHLSNKNMKIRCDNLQQSSTSATAEYERLKIAYDALKASQVEYKRHYEHEISQLQAHFDKFKREHLSQYEALQQKLGSNDKDIDTLLDGLTNKRKTLDSLYFNKNKLIIDLLSKLALVSKTHGQETKAILQDNVDTVHLLMEKYPDLPIKLKETEDVEINLEELLSESSSVANNSFDEEATLVNSPDPNEAKTTRQTGLAGRRRRNNNKRNSIRFDRPDHERARTPTPPSHNQNTDRFKKPLHEQHNNVLHNNTTHNSNHNKGKRRSMYGHYNKRQEEVTMGK